MKLFALFFLTSLSVFASNCYEAYYKNDVLIMLSMNKNKNKNNNNLYDVKITYNDFDAIHEFQMNLARRARCIDCNQDVFESTPNSQIQMSILFNGNVSKNSELGTLTFKSLGRDPVLSEKLDYRRVDCQ